MDSMTGKIMKLAQALQELECQKQALDAHAIVAITDPSGKITYVNDKFCQISQYSREELIGKDHRIVNSGYHSRSYFRNLWKTVSQGKVWQNETKNRAKDGSIYWVNTTVFPVVDDTGSVVRHVSIRNDITERKLLEESLHHAKDEAQKLRDDMISINVELRAALKQANVLAQKAVTVNRIKSDFLADMSHEIRTPINGVIGFMEMLLDTPLDSNQLEYAETSKRSAEVLLALINNILDLSKIEAGKMQFEQIDFNLQKVVDDVWNLFRSTLMKPSVELSHTISNDVPLDLQGDPIRLHQVLLNLLGNAAKFTEEGKITLTIHLQNTLQNKVELLFVMQDTGIGIDRNRQKNIFDVFEQSRSSTSRVYGGSGLGLAIVKRIVEQLGGQIKVESDPGKGATFSFTMPFTQRYCSPRPDQSNTNQVLPHSTSLSTDAPIHILLVEDNKDNQFLIREILDKADHRLDVALDGSEAMEKCKKEKYDLILMDVQMPVMGGLEATKAIRQIPNFRTPIVAITACAMKTDRETCLAAGMDDYITKPITRDIIYEKINQWAIHRRRDSSDVSTSQEKTENVEMPSNDSEVIVSHWEDYPDLQELAHVFAQVMPLMQEQLQTALDNKNIENLKGVAEKFKSAATSGGYPELSLQAEQIILSAGQDEIDDIAQSVAHLNSLCDRVSLSKERQITI